MKLWAFVIALAIVAVSDHMHALAQERMEIAKEKASNLGPPVNSSEFGEYAPTISADGRTLIFETNGSGKWKLCESRKTPDGWTEPKQLDKVNKAGWVGGPFLTYDGNALIFSSDKGGGVGGNDLWMSRRVGDDWMEPVNLGVPVNTDGYEGFASLSPDGTELYFQRYAMSDGTCRRVYHFDLYCSRKIDGQWSEPVKLPAPINTGECEKLPIILADGKTVVFSSIRQGGYGDYDLYKSEKLGNGQWSEPVNLGSFINTPQEDALVAIPASGDILCRE